MFNNFLVIIPAFFFDDPVYTGLLIKEAIICLFLIPHHLLYLQLDMRNSSGAHSKFGLMRAITPQSTDQNFGYRFRIKY
jgi:hypothetical protein